MEPGPQIISDFYLDAFLESVKSSGYTIFVIRGDPLPEPNRSENSESLRPNQFYIGLNYLKLHYENNKNRKLNIDGADESELEAAIKASLDDANMTGYQVPDSIRYGNENYNDQLQQMTGEAQPSNEDDELARAIALSLQQEQDNQEQND